jgi:hypothetical protein
MARIRTIKPEFWSNEKVMACSRDARLLFIGLWNFADDCGRLPSSLNTIKAQVFPFDEIDSTNVRRMLDELSSNGLLFEYEVEGRVYIQISGWNHQKIDRPQPAKYPNPDSSNARRTFATDLILSNLKERKKEDGTSGRSLAMASGPDNPVVERRGLSTEELKEIVKRKGWVQ